VHLTFSPNGIYAPAWAPHAPVLAPLIDAGQVQIMNHTFTHANLTRLPVARIREELERNETWIGRTFATTARPYYRPPFGYHNLRVDAVAAEVGFNRVVLWDGTYSDSQPVTPQFLMDQARTYLHPGVILLGHANHPTVLGLFDQITQLIRDRALSPVTLDEMFGTSRHAATGKNRTSTVEVPRAAAGPQDQQGPPKQCRCGMAATVRSGVLVRSPAAGPKAFLFDDLFEESLMACVRSCPYLRRI
jgi:Polysaccharide deacetylase